MKKFILFSTLATTTTMPCVSLVSCNTTTCNLKILTDCCSVEGAKDSYKVNDDVWLKFTPLPLFKLPSKEDVVIGGTNSFDWNPQTGELHFKILTNAVIIMDVSCGTTQISWKDANRWITSRTAKAVTFTKTHCSYSCSGFSKTEDEDIWATIVKEIKIMTTKTITDLSGEFFVDTPFTYDTKVAPSLKWIPEYPENTFFANDEEIFILAGKVGLVIDVYLPINFHYNNDLVPYEICWSWKNTSIPLISEDEEVKMSKPINFELDITYEF